MRLKLDDRYHLFTIDQEALKYLEDRKKELPSNDNNSNPTFDQLVNQIINNNGITSTNVYYSQEDRLDKIHA